MVDECGGLGGECGLTSLTGDGGGPGRNEFTVDQPADEHEACAAEGIRWLRKQLVSKHVLRNWQDTRAQQLRPPSWLGSGRGLGRRGLG